MSACVCANQETQEVRGQTDRQMDRQVQVPIPPQGHSAETYLASEIQMKHTLDNVTFSPTPLNTKKHSRREIGIIPNKDLM